MWFLHRRLACVLFLLNYTGPACILFFTGSFFLSFFKLGGSPNLFLSLRFLLSSFFFFLSSHNLLLLPHALSDFDQTWSEWPVSDQLQKLSTVWPQRSCRGHRGQKGHFYGKCYSSYTLHSRGTWLMHINNLDILYKNYHLTDQSGVIWGHRGQKNKVKLQTTSNVKSNCVNVSVLG